MSEASEPIVLASLASITNIRTAGSIASPGALTVTAVRAWVINASVTTAAWVQLFDAASTADVTLGTTIPDWVVKVNSFSDGGTTDGDGIPVTSRGLAFTNGLVAAVTSDAPTGTTVQQTHVAFCTN